MGKDNKDRDFFVTRGEDGELQPINGVTPTLGIRIKVIPLTYGASRRYPSFGSGFHDWSDIEKAQLLREHVIEADEKEGVFDDLDEDGLQNMEAWTVEDLLTAVALYSGFGRLFEKQEVKKEDLPEPLAGL